MVRERLRQYSNRIRAEIYSSLTAEYSTRQVAGSFAIGTFITMMPTLGTGVLVFFVLIYVFDWMNKIALFASVLVFNPVVKWGVYAASFALGIALLGPVDGFGIGDVPSISEGNDILVRLLVGNTILAIIAAVLSYVVVYRLVDAYEDRAFPVVAETVDQFVDELEGKVEQPPEATAERSADQTDSS